ncbi:MAG: peptidase domain-containing ABC transporter [Clostridium sp.]|nr:peptidase domain-containing ABC transporter [Clostridium sp.]MCM1476191.1 peptidase domain-containing ABC transporter [Muribaculaceae bacterium]
MGFRIYRQLESSDCGFACIRMLAKHYGQNIPLSYLKKTSDYSRVGMSISDISTCLKKLGMESYAVRIEKKKIDDIPNPCILLLNNNHYVVLYKISENKKKYFIADPSLGKQKFTYDQLMEQWLNQTTEGDVGYAVIAEPEDKFYKQSYENRKSITELFKSVTHYFNKYNKLFLTTIIINIIILGLDLLLPILLKTSIDDGIGSKNISLILAIIVAQILITIGTLTGSTITNILMSTLGLRINKAITGELLRNFIKKPISFFDKHSLPDFIQKIEDLEKIKDFVIQFPQTILFAATSFIFFSCLLYHYSPTILIIFCIFASIEAYWSIFFLERTLSLNSSLFNHSSDARNIIYEIVNGIHELRLNQAESSRVSLWDKTQDRINEFSLKFQKVISLQNGGLELISKVKELGIIALCGILVVNDEITIGIMFTISYICGRLSVPVKDLCAQIQNFQNASIANDRVNEINTTERLAVEEVNTRYSPNNTEIRFENVFFKYSGNHSPYVIKNFSFTIDPGKVIALVGESGCGKSTLIKLMLGLYQPQMGKILLGGKNSECINKSEWYSLCAAVMQTGYIFSDTIAQNITLNAEAKLNNYDRILTSIKMAGLYEFISNLPKGLETRLGNTGIELSGGQKQRVMIARALYRDSQIIFLDEATSSLDSNNEYLIYKNFQKIFKNKTIVIAAHRLSTIKSADMILYIKDGQIAEAGNHQELIEMRGEYWKLVQKQLQSA